MRLGTNRIDDLPSKNSIDETKISRMCLQTGFSICFDVARIIPSKNSINEAEISRMCLQTGLSIYVSTWRTSYRDVVSINAV
jgi:hypothetical protein